MSGIMIAIQWMGTIEWYEKEGIHACNSCSPKDLCGYVGSEGEFMREIVEDSLGKPLVLACSGWMPIEKPWRPPPPICTLSPTEAQQVKGELHKAREEREAKEGHHD